jgi:aconitate hydratase
MDARSIAATALNGGVLTSALGLNYNNEIPPFNFDNSIYNNRIFDGFDKGDINEPLVYGPNIADWPALPALTKRLYIEIVAVINDEVTTTDELIPSGEASSYRSNPLRLAEFTLSRKVPNYVKKAKLVKEKALGSSYCDVRGLGSAIYANKPGDGSAREQAASCQRILGGVANIAKQYATKRYRSNLINWGMLPLIYDNAIPLLEDDVIIIYDTDALLADLKTKAQLLRESKDGETAQVFDIWLTLDPLTDTEKAIIKAGCLINYDREQK